MASSGGTPQSGDPGGSGDAGLRELLRDPVVVNGATVRGVVAVVAFFAVVLTPPGHGYVADIAGGALAVVALTELVWVRRTASWPERLRLVATIGIGIAVAAWPVATATTLGLFVGIWLLALSGLSAGQAVVNRIRGGDVAWPVARTALALCVAITVLIWPAGTARIVLAGVGIGWVGAAVVALAYGVPRWREHSEIDVPPDETIRIVALWLSTRELSTADRDRVDAKLFFEGPAFRARISRFVVLLALSVVIATLGILTDSTAVVIGAMLIAPLMTPIMATAAALVTGWPARATKASLTVLGGTLGAIALSFTLGRFLPFFGDLATNSQVLSRVSPTMLDLLIALAAGAAGAFAIAREDVSDSLPGVAIAVALVPPLSVVGVSLEAGSIDDALGAFLLYLTNLVAILLAGGIVLVLAGFAPVERLRSEQRRIRVYVATVATGVFAVLIPLTITGNQIATSVLAQNEAERAVRAWLVDRDDAEVLRLQVTDGRVEVVAVGAGNPPEVDDLFDLLATELGYEPVVDLRWVPEVRTVVTPEDRSSG